MPVYKSVPVKPSEITPEHVYLNRREFLKAMGVVSASALLLAACGIKATPGSTPQASAATQSPAGQAPTGQGGADVDEMGSPANTYDEIANYNNFYEFTTDKAGVARLAQDFKTSPWQVEVYGLVNKPMTFGIEDLLAKFTQEERIYRLRCVEAWSMVIPWQGFPLAALLKEVDPLSSAKFVRFETLMDPEQFPGQRSRLYPWPYQEGLRLDEAMNDLTLIATGLYGKPLPNSTGAPLRLVAPWKYGFKSIKSIVKIELVDTQPETMWSTIAPNEYGFYSNVNPEVNHPRWSQASERRIGETGRRPTLMFNGYAEEVAHLYEGMDLAKYY
ncbi:MAG: protein-methionine-sulfoxide reductase catalytic subunit MsrP [Chloroflexota bacterium]